MSNPAEQRPFDVQDWRSSCSRSGHAKQRSLPTQTRASAFAIAAAIITSVRSTALTSLPADQVPPAHVDPSFGSAR